MNPDDTGLEARMDRLRQLAGRAAFKPGFADRVMARLERQPSLADGMQAVFLRLAPLAAAAILILGTINLVHSRSTGQPFVDRVLSLQAVSLATAYSMETNIAVWKEAGR